MDMNEMQNVRKSDILLVAIKNAMFDGNTSDKGQAVLRNQYNENTSESQFDCILRIGNEIEATELNWHISFIIRHLNIPPHAKGYKYLRDAIRMMVLTDDPDGMSYITKSIYPDIAKKYKSTPAAVERSIRHAIREMGKASYLRKTIYLGRDKPSYSNKEVILGIADYVKFGGNETRFKVIENDGLETVDSDPEGSDDELMEDVYEDFMDDALSVV